MSEVRQIGLGMKKERFKYNFENFLVKDYFE